jgi:hypothetical protein
MALVLSGPARPRSLVIRTISRLPSFAPAQERMLVAAETAARSARISSSSSEYGRAASVDSWARRSLDAATNCIARVICLMFLDA